MAKIKKIGKVWYSDLRMGGKRVRKPLSANRELAEKKLADLVQLRHAERHQDGLDDLSWELFRAKHLVYSKGEKAANSQRQDRTAFKLLEKFKSPAKVSDVTPDALESLKFHLKEIGGNPNTINRRIHALKAAMRKAEEWGFGRGQDWKRVKDIKTTVARIDWLTVKDLSRLLAELKGDYRIVGYLGARCGFRLGEILHTHWEDVDWSMNRLNITPKPGWNPKDYEKRFVPIPKDCLNILRSIQRPHIGPILGEHSYQGLSLLMARHMRRIVGRGSTHTLRHTYASHLVQAGVPIYTVSKLLGHASVKTTERHYAHLAQSHLDDAATKLPVLV